LVEVIKFFAFEVVVGVIEEPDEVFFCKLGSVTFLKEVCNSFEVVDCCVFLSSIEGAEDGVADVIGDVCEVWFSVYALSDTFHEFANLTLPWTVESDSFTDLSKFFGFSLDFVEVVADED